VKRLLLLVAVLTTGTPGVGLAQDEGDRAWRAGDFATAWRIYSARVAADSTDDRALHRVALMAAWDRRYDESLHLFDLLLALGPNLEAEVDRARVVAWRGRPLDAVRLLDSLLARERGYIPALQARAEFLAWAGETQRAVSSYEELAQILPENRSVRGARARLLSWSARLDESIALYDSLVRTDPSDREARLGLGRTLAWAGELDSAAAVYRALLARDSSDVDAWAGLAQTESWGGRLRSAERTWRRSLVADSTSVAALAGLAQTLRWQGRDAAAREVLARAEGLAPASQEMRDQRRWVEAALRPRAHTTFTYENDSDGNGIFTLLGRGGSRVLPRLDLRVLAYLRWLDVDAPTSLAQQAFGGAIEAWAQLEPGWSFAASLGASDSDADTVGTQARWAVRASSPGWWRVMGTASVTREPLDVTVQLVRSGVSVVQAALDTRAAPAGGWTATGAISLAWFQGTETNLRTAGAVGATRRLARAWTVGGAARIYGFSKDLTDGYFDPSLYVLLEAPARWHGEFARWAPALEVAPGLQKITGSDLSAAIRLGGEARYVVAPGREIALSAGYSTLGFSLFAESGGGYRYRYVTLAGSWGF
jgi:tetratricopeptide (TPR) repeat protein